MRFNLRGSIFHAFSHLHCFKLWTLMGQFCVIKYQETGISILSRLLKATKLNTDALLDTLWWCGRGNGHQLGGSSL